MHRQFRVCLAEAYLRSKRPVSDGYAAASNSFADLSRTWIPVPKSYVAYRYKFLRSAQVDYMSYKNRSTVHMLLVVLLHIISIITFMRADLYPTLHGSVNNQELEDNQIVLWLRNPRQFKEWFALKGCQPRARCLVREAIIDSGRGMNALKKACNHDKPGAIRSECNMIAQQLILQMENGYTHILRAETLRHSFI